MPTPITQGESFAFYLGDGATTTFLLGFEFLNDAHINVFVNGAALVNPDDFDVTANAVVFDVAPVLGADVRLVRVTPKQYSQRLVDFRPFGSITEDEMDLNQKQLWFLIQEAAETDDSGNANPNAEYISWDAIRTRWTALRGAIDQRIGDVAYPAESNEAAPKGYVDDIAEWGIAGIPQGWELTTVGVNTNYTLPGGELIDPRYLIVAIDGALQVPITDYTVQQGSPDSTLILLGPPPASGLTINVMNFGKTRFVNISNIAPNSVDTAAIQDGAVTTAKLAALGVTLAKLAPDSVDSSKIVDLSVQGADIADNQISYAKLNKTAAFATAPGGGIDQALMIDEGSGTLLMRQFLSTDVADWLAALQAVPINTFANATASVHMGGQKITNLQAPTSALDAVNKAYADGLGNAGAKMDLLADVSLGATSNDWTLFTGNPSWWSDSTYLSYTFRFVNWRKRGGGKIIFKFLQLGVWSEDWYSDGPYAWEEWMPMSFDLNVQNPRSGSWMPTVQIARNEVGRTGFGGLQVVYGPSTGFAIRAESTTIPGAPNGARCLIYGHKALI